MRLPIVFSAVTFSLLVAAPALALDQAKHRSISENSCRSAGLDPDFCERLGKAAYNVDSYEWTNLAAHSQPEAGQSLCDAVNAAADREASLGGEIHAALQMPASQDRAEALADAMGRALHTIQDNCAHKGVANPQHAWFSLMDSCDGTKLSPDVQPDSVSCANSETESVMYEFAKALYNAGVSNNELSSVGGTSTHWPTRGGACEFLDGSKDWDGHDVRWNNAVVSPGLRDAFVLSLSGNAPYQDFCQLPASELAHQNPQAPVDTSAGPDWCLKLNVFCIGKADAPDEAPPWIDPATAQPPATSSSDDSGGCSMPARGPTPSNGYWLAGLAGLAIAARRQKRR